MVKSFWEERLQLIGVVEQSEEEGGRDAGIGDREAYGRCED